jgi:hypothetical protein
MDAELLEVFIPIVAIVFGSLMFLIPIAAVSLRYAIKPVMEAIRANREAQGGSTRGDLAALEHRLALLEQNFHNLESSVDRLADVKDFERRLVKPGETEPTTRR